MMISARVLVVASLVLMLAVPAVSAFPEVGEEIYTWHSPEDPADDSSDRCKLTGTTPNSAPAPCEVLGYSIGNTDTHLHLRWTLSTSEFGPLGSAASVILRQGFSGATNANNPSFGFCAKMDADGVATYEHASCSATEGWAGAVESKLTTGTPGFVEFAVPLTLLEPHMNGTFQAGTVKFDVTDLATRVNNVDGSEAVVPWVTAFAPADTITVPSNENTYALRPYGSLQLPPPESNEVYENRTGLPLVISKEYEEATTETLVYNWSMDADAFIVNQTTEILTGDLNISIVDSGNVSVLDAALANGTLEETITGISPGNWTIRIALEGFTGSFELRLEAPPMENGEDPGTDNGEGEDGEDENGEEDGGEPDVEDNGIPAPGFILLVLATLAVVAIVRRR